MVNEVITEIEQGMLSVLDNAQMQQLRRVLSVCLSGLKIERGNERTDTECEQKNGELLKKFLAAKHVEGCSSKSLRYYFSTIENLFKFSEKSVRRMTTDDLRNYLDVYRSRNNASKVTIDNVRRILSSFFAWLEDEDYIVKSPVRRIHKVKTGQSVKETYTDEALEQMRDNAGTLRDLAIIDLLASTGMRVGEMVKLNRADVDFENRECVVFGKGARERKVYFDARTKIHLQKYLASREDDNPALFVSLLKPATRLLIRGVEVRLRELGRKLNIPKVHPHKFRRTLATRAIDKGMPIEQVQHLLGHSKIDTTMQYAMVDQNNVKISHKRFLG